MDIDIPGYIFLSSLHSAEMVKEKQNKTKKLYFAFYLKTFSCVAVSLIPTGKQRPNFVLLNTNRIPSDFTGSFAWTRNTEEGPINSQKYPCAFLWTNLISVVYQVFTLWHCIEVLCKLSHPCEVLSGLSQKLLFYILKLQHALGGSIPFCVELTDLNNGSMWMKLISPFPCLYY